MLSMDDALRTIWTHFQVYFWKVSLWCDPGHLWLTPAAAAARSNGCTIGCDTCDGTNNHPGHGSQQFLYKGMNISECSKNNVSVEAWGLTEGDMVLDPQSHAKLNITQGLCPNSPKTKATICDSSLRTLNIYAECGSPEDICEPRLPLARRALPLRALTRVSMVGAQIITPHGELLAWLPSLIRAVRRAGATQCRARVRTVPPSRTARLHTSG